MDFTLCVNALCPKRDICLRYISIPDKIQSYSNFEDCVAPEYRYYIEYKGEK